MKAKELNPELFPRKEVVAAYEKVGWKYEETIHDRVWKWFYPLVTANDRLRNREIKYQIDALYRTKNHEGEWLTYHVSLFGRDWKGNRIDYSYMEGMIEGMPEFHMEIDPQTDEVVPGTTQIEERYTEYKIPFSKEKVNELQKHFSPTASFSVTGTGTGGKRYTVTQEQFTDTPYTQLISELTGFSEYIKMRNKKYNGN